MRYTKSTRYALYAALEMSTGQEPVSVAGLARRYRIPESALARSMQGLVRAGIALGRRGASGGYRLARPPSEITVLEVISVFDPPREPGDCLLADGAASGCEEPLDCRLRRLFDEVDELARCTFASVTLETLARGSGVRR